MQCRPDQSRSCVQKRIPNSRGSCACASGGDCLSTDAVDSSGDTADGADSLPSLVVQIPQLSEMHRQEAEAHEQLEVQAAVSASTLLALLWPRRLCTTPNNEKYLERFLLEDIHCEVAYDDEEQLIFPFEI